MPRTARLTDALPRRRALLFAGSAAALIGAGATAVTTAAAASAATTPVLHAPATAQAPALTGRAPAAPVLGTAAAHNAASAATATTTAAVRHSAPAPRRHSTAPARPYQMYDSVTPSAIPGGKAAATYADGPYAATPSQLTGHGPVTWIDTNGTDPKGATALDVEPGDATPQMAATWTAQHLDAHPHGTAVIYTMRSDWAATQTAIAGLPRWQQHDVRYWIADPTGTPHLVPGSSATQWYWGSNYDISTVTPGF
jgi:hypothetical protein